MQKLVVAAYPSRFREMLQIPEKYLVPYRLFRLASTHPQFFHILNGAQ